eukprot:COSAG01_NODE_10529_length_2140_cov_3.620284_1_plen_68_part_10
MPRARLAPGAAVLNAKEKSHWDGPRGVAACRSVLAGPLLAAVRALRPSAAGRDSVHGPTAAESERLHH